MDFQILHMDPSKFHILKISPLNFRNLQTGPLNFTLFFLKTYKYGLILNKHVLYPNKLNYK